MYPNLRRLALLFGMLAASAPGASAAEAQSRVAALYQALSTPGPGQVNAMKTVAANAEIMPTQFMYLASGIAFQEKQLEIAGLLYYAGQIRAQFDNALFPPGGTGAESPLAALGALRQALGAEINFAVATEPKIFAAVLARLKAWNPRAPNGYNPGWSYTERGTEAAAADKIAESRAAQFKSLNDLCTLLQEQEYFAAYRVGQDYNRTRGPDRPSKERYDAAIDTLKRIETEKGIPGIGSSLKK